MDLASAIDRLQGWRSGLFLQTEKHVARPVCTREQQQRPASEGNRTEHRASAAHTFTLTLSVSHTHTRTHMQGFTSVRPTQACSHTHSLICCRGQFHAARHVKVNGNKYNNTVRHMHHFSAAFHKTCAHTFTRMACYNNNHPHTHLWWGLCVKGRGRQKERVWAGKFWGAPPWSENNKKHIHERSSRMNRSTSEGLNGQSVLNQQITFIWSNLFCSFFHSIALCVFCFFHKILICCCSVLGHPVCDCDIPHVSFGVS